MKVAIYSCVSKKDLELLSVQTYYLKEYAIQHGWIIDEIVESVFSSLGRSIKMPHQDIIFEKVESQQVNLVLVWYLRHWGRSVGDLVQSFIKLQKNNCQFIAISEDFYLNESLSINLNDFFGYMLKFDESLKEKKVTRKKLVKSSVQKKYNHKKKGTPAQIYFSIAFKNLLSQLTHGTMQKKKLSYNKINDSTK